MISQERLKDLIDYNADTGEFKRFLKNGARTAGSVNSQGYLHIMLDKKLYKAHRLAWLYTYGDFPDGQIDHVNQDRADNRLSNLRVVDNAENNKNRSICSNNKSGVLGVSYWNKANRWEVKIAENKRNKRLGLFSDFFEAVCARKSAENRLGYHTNHGKRGSLNG